MATAWHTLSPGKRKCHSLRGLTSEEERGRGKGRKKIQVSARKHSNRIDALLLIFVAMEFLYNQINHLASNPPTHSLT